jgi:hypothetical protein
VADARGFVVDLIDELVVSGRELNALRLGEDSVAKTVCRHAVKANDPLAGPELENLIDDLRRCDMPYTCPHGRPTLIEMSYRELEKNRAMGKIHGDVPGLYRCASTASGQESSSGRPPGPSPESQRRCLTQPPRLGGPFGTKAPPLLHCEGCRITLRFDFAHGPFGGEGKMVGLRRHGVSTLPEASRLLGVVPWQTHRQEKGRTVAHIGRGPPHQQANMR